MTSGHALALKRSRVRLLSLSGKGQSARSIGTHSSDSGIQKDNTEIRSGLRGNKRYVWSASSAGGFVQ